MSDHLEASFAILLGYTILREVFFLWSMQKLLNKAMSKNFAEYMQAKKKYVPIQPSAETEQIPDDFTILRDFGGI